MFINKISHKYPTFCLDVENLNLEKNSIIGLLGENGAGKSTLMNILSGYIKPNGHFNVENWNDISILYIPSDLDIYEYLTVKEFITLIVKYSKTCISIMDIIEKIDMKDKQDTLIEELSLGMKKKLTLIPIFLKDYDLIILDEPFNSIDLAYISALKKFILSLKSKSTILISSHILDTLADICDKFILIQDGFLKKELVNKKDILNLESEIFDRNI
ncbi:MAG: ATP-binding cassette domain-containing protein [Paraclostridium sordellii]